MKDHVQLQYLFSILKIRLAKSNISFLFFSYTFQRITTMRYLLIKIGFLLTVWISKPPSVAQ